MTDRTPAEIAEIMAPVCKALTEISDRARSFGIAARFAGDASIAYYPTSREPWVAYLWLRAAQSITGRGQTPMEAVAALAEQVDASDPALNWKTLGVEVAA